MMMSSDRGSLTLFVQDRNPSSTWPSVTLIGCSRYNTVCFQCVDELEGLVLKLTFSSQCFSKKISKYATKALKVNKKGTVKDCCQWRNVKSENPSGIAA